MKRRAGGLVSILAAAMLLIAAAPHAAMHLKLDRSEPAKDASVAASPAAIQLWYSQEPQVRLTTVKLTGPAGTMDLKPVSVVDGDGRHLSAPVARPLAAGAYTVAWRTLAKDGHVVSGEFGFRVTGQ